MSNASDITGSRPKAATSTGSSIVPALAVSLLLSDRKTEEQHLDRSPGERLGPPATHSHVPFP